jgi:hypothetical protein
MKSYKCIDKGLKKEGFKPEKYESIVTETEKQAIEGNLSISSNFYFVEIQEIAAPKEALIKTTKEKDATKE